MAKSYQCSHCNYKFSPKNPDKVPQNCPYCNKPETIEPVKSAQDYIDEISGEPQEKKG